MIAYPRNRIGVYAVLTAVALATDLISKSVVFNRLGGVFQGTGWLIDGWLKFELHTSLNAGALWGMGQGFASGFALLSVVAVVGIVYWLFFRGAAASLWLTVALSLVSGGAFGNCYDRLGLHGEHFPNDPEPALAVRLSEISIRDVRLSHLQHCRFIPCRRCHHVDDPVREAGREFGPERINGFSIGGSFILIELIAFVVPTSVDVACLISSEVMTRSATPKISVDLYSAGSRAFAERKPTLSRTINFQIPGHQTWQSHSRTSNPPISSSPLDCLHSKLLSGAPQSIQLQNALLR